MANSAKVISVHSYKGGTGKTTLALGLASLINNESKETVVYLIDADLTGSSITDVFPDQDRPSKNLGDYLTEAPFQSERISLKNLRWDINIRPKRGHCSLKPSA